MKLKVFAILLAFIAGTAPILVLIAFTNKLKNQSNGFDRMINNSVLKPEKIIELDEYGYYFAGDSKTNLVLGNYQLGNRILEIDSSLNDLSLSSFILPSSVNWSTIELSINDCQLIASDRMTGKIFAGVSGNFSNSLLVNNSFKFFSLWTGCNGSIIIKTPDSALQQNVLALINFKTGQAIKSPALVKQNEGFFSVDGQLVNYLSDKYLYVYRYRNHVLIMDSLLNTLSVFKTIDTASQTKNTVESYASGKKLGFANPSVTVNKFACITGKYLIINSGIKADNELLNTFRENAIFDVYDVETKKYLNSFYISTKQLGSVKNIRAIGKSLFILFEKKHLAKYHLKL